MESTNSMRNRPNLSVSLAYASTESLHSFALPASLLGPTGVMGLALELSWSAASPESWYRNWQYLSTILCVAIKQDISLLFGSQLLTASGKMSLTDRCRLMSSQIGLLLRKQYVPSQQGKIPHTDWRSSWVFSRSDSWSSFSVQREFLHPWLMSSYTASSKWPKY